MKTKNALCKGCAISKPRTEMYSRHYCTADCLLKFPKKRKGCQPECDTATAIYRNVIFANGTEHLQIACSKCRRTDFVSKIGEGFGPNRYNLKSDKIARKIKRVEKRSLNDAIIEKSSFLKDRYGDSFYVTPAWLQLRFAVLTRYGSKCMLCNSISGTMHVDHIKPRSKYPQLALKIDNLQILCGPCNIGKSNLDETDFRNLNNNGKRT